MTLCLEPPRLEQKLDRATAAGTGAGGLRNGAVNASA